MQCRRGLAAVFVMTVWHAVDGGGLPPTADCKVKVDVLCYLAEQICSAIIPAICATAL